VIAEAGGALFSALRAPLPWMLGLCLHGPLENSWVPICSPNRGPATGQLLSLRTWFVLHSDGRRRGRRALVSADRGGHGRGAARLRERRVPNAPVPDSMQPPPFRQRSGGAAE